jgi:hypothetical protein
MTMVKATAIVLAGAAILALIGPATAAQRHKRTHSETGPLILSSSFGPQASSRRPRKADICVPVTIKRRPMFSTLLKPN